MIFKFCFPYSYNDGWGSDFSSRYAVYSDSPGGVFSTHGLSLVPFPLTLIFDIGYACNEVSY